MNQFVINSHDAKLKLLGRLALNFGLAIFLIFTITILFQPFMPGFSLIKFLTIGNILYFLLILFVFYLVFICLKKIFLQLVGRQIIVSNQELIYKNRFFDIKRINLLSIKEIVSENCRSYGKSLNFVQIVFYDINNQSIFTCDNVNFFSKKQLGQLLSYLQKNISPTTINFTDNLDLIKDYQYPTLNIFRYLIAFVVLLPFFYFSYTILSGGIKPISIFLACFLTLIPFFLATHVVEDLA